MGAAERVAREVRLAQQVAEELDPLGRRQRRAGGGGGGARVERGVEVRIASVCVYVCVGDWRRGCVRF